MAIHKLTPRKVATAGPGKYEDGGGLRLVVSNTGAKKWVLRFTIDGKRREMGLGSFPDVGLAEARDKATEHRKQAKESVDPIEVRQTEPEKTPTFTTCAARYIRAHRRGWKNAKHARQWVSTLKTYARPEIGKKKVDAITTEDILKILSRLDHQDRNRQAGARPNRKHPRLCRRPQIPLSTESRPLSRPPGQAVAQTYSGEESHPSPRHAAYRSSRLHGGVRAETEGTVSNEATEPVCRSLRRQSGAWHGLARRTACRVACKRRDGQSDSSVLQNCLAFLLYQADTMYISSTNGGRSWVNVPRWPFLFLPPQF